VYKPFVILIATVLLLLSQSHNASAIMPIDNVPSTKLFPNQLSDISSWSMAGANPQRTSWIPEGVDPRTSAQFGVEWYRPIEAYIGQHIQLITARNKVYVSTARGVYALDVASGDEVWHFDTEMPIGHSPTILDDVLYVGGFDKRVYALNADTGTLLWTFAGAKGGFSTNPLVVGGKVLLGCRDGYFYALDKNNGNLLWQFPPANQESLAPILFSAAYKDGKVFFAANDNYGYALDVNSGTLIWKSDKMPGDGYQAWWPVVYGDYVVFSGSDSYAHELDPGTHSIRNVVDKNDPYYEQMYEFNHGEEFIGTFQRDDVFYAGPPTDNKIGLEFKAGGLEDKTGIAWSWGNGAMVTDASKITEYLENDGQTKVNRATNKPWRRNVSVLNVSDGRDFTFDSDRDGRPEYPPFLFVGKKYQYPPLVIPTKNAKNSYNDVLYAQNFSRYSFGWEIPRANLTAWQFGTQYIHIAGTEFAIDEPFANSAGGSIVYSNLCCDRVGAWNNIETGNSGTLWDYQKTLESIKMPLSDVEYYQATLAPGYDEMWWESSMYSGLPRVSGNYGTMNGIYHNHGLQNPIIPYKGRLFVHRSNAIIAFGPNPVAIDRQETLPNLTPKEYEQYIKNKYPNFYKPLLKINTPNQVLKPTVTLQDIQANLDNQIIKMLQKGHLQPGYYNTTFGHRELANYFENPGDTLYTLVQAYPYVSENIKPNLEKYIKQHYKRYFETEMYSRTGFWIENPDTYDLNNIDGVGQLQPRTWTSYPPEIALDIKNYQASTWTGYGWPWDYPQQNIYALWRLAKTFYSNDSLKLKDIYNKAKSKLDTTPPDTNYLHEKPWVHNAYIAGYMGFLNLQELAGKVQDDLTLRTTVETKLKDLLSIRANDFRKDNPWSNPMSNERSFNVARNFINMIPELGDYLYNNAFDKVNEAVNEYNWVAPYWVATRYEATQREQTNDNLYTHPAMFQAKAYILKEPAEQLLKYIDAPTFETGDLFYIQNLAGILSSTLKPPDPTPTQTLNPNTPTLTQTPTPTPNPGTPTPIKTLTQTPTPTSTQTSTGITINLWEDNHQGPVLTTTSDRGDLNETDNQWTEFLWTSRGYPGVFAGSHETPPLMRFYASVPNGTYTLIANLYWNDNLRYYWGYSANNPEQYSYDVTRGSRGNFAEYTLGKVMVTNGQFELYTRRADSLSGGNGYPFWGWAWIRLIPEDVPATDTPAPTGTATPAPTSEPIAEPTNEPTPGSTSEPTPQQPVSLALAGPTSVETGGTLEMSVMAQNVPTPGLYGVQFEINYDPSLISVNNLQVNPNLSFVVLNNADNTTGKIILVASQQGKVSGLTGNVTLLNFQVTAGNKPGLVTFEFNNQKFSNSQAQGFNLNTAAYNITLGQITTPEPTAQPTSVPTNQPTPQPTSLPTVQPTTQPTPTTEPTATPSPQPTLTPTSQPSPTPTATPTSIPTTNPTPEPPLPTPTPTTIPQPLITDISGQVMAIGRANNNWAGSTISIASANPQVTLTDLTGSFHLSGIPAGEHTLTADAPGYLSAVCANAVITAPATVLVPATLLSGDITDDDLVDIVDATAVGASFGRTGQDLVADITLDGVIDIFDIVLVSVNFGEAGPQAWNCSK
jgi:hypothetical protein